MTTHRPSLRLALFALCALCAVLLCATSTAFADDALVDLNTASSEELDTLPRIGPSKAAAIIAWRQANGPFKTPQDLTKVRGIGDATFAKLCHKVVVKGARGCEGGGAVEAELPTDFDNVEVIVNEDGTDPRINLNTAPVDELDVLPGIGPARAKTIIERRSKRPWRSPKELLEIRGIGPKTLAKLLPFVRTTTDVNHVTVEELVATGAVPSPVAVAIVKARDARKGFKAMADLKKVPGVTAEVYNGLTPFLTLR